MSGARDERQAEIASILRTLVGYDAATESVGFYDATGEVRTIRVSALAGELYRLAAGRIGRQR